MKNIPLKGLEKSELKSAGSMEILTNLLPEDGVLKPLCQPLSTGMELPPQALKTLAMHHLPSGASNIIFSLSDGGIGAMPLAGGNWCRIGTFTGAETAVAVGNALTVGSSSGICHLLHDGNRYRFLGSKPPFVPITFALNESPFSRRETTASTVIEGGAAFLAGEPLEGTPRPQQRLSAEERNRACGQLSDHVLGLVSKAEREAAEVGLFTSPFFVRYALRLADGNYTLHSAPVLMCPSALAPQVAFHGAFSGNDAEITSSLRLRACSLQYRIGAFDTAALAEWSDLIAGIDIFVSPGFAAHDTGGKVEGSRATAIFDDEYDGTYKALGETFWKAHTQGENGPSDPSIRAWQLPDNPHRRREMATNALFYKIASLDLEHIAASETFQPLKPEEESLTGLRQFAILDDDFESHAEIGVGAMLAFNSRLHLADITLHPALPLPLTASLPHNDSDPVVEVDVRICLKKNGKLTAVSCRMPVPPEEPQYLWYPDPDAVSLTIGERVYQLKRHEMLHGAFWLKADGEEPQTSAASPKSGETAVSLPGYVYTSAISNPFHFSPKGVMAVSGRRILALATAAKEMSAGQFGQFPIYVFTEEGIMALEIGSEGWPVRAVPVSHEVITGPQALVAADPGVFFLSARGLMLLDGARCRHLSEALEGDCADDYPLLDRILTRLGIQALLPDFSGFLASGEARMIADRLRGRLVLFIPGTSPAYVYSLKSGEWGMMETTLRESLGEPGRPLAVDAEGNMVELFCGEEPRGVMLAYAGRLAEGFCSRRLRWVKADTVGTPVVVAAWTTDRHGRWRFRGAEYGGSLRIPVGSGGHEARVLVISEGGIRRLETS